MVFLGNPRPEPPGSPKPPKSTPTLTPAPPPNSSEEWKQTVYALNALRDEFVALGIGKNKAEVTMVNNFAKGFVYEFMPYNDSNVWSMRIEKLQQENSILPTGYITKNDETYNVLKCKMAKDLNLTEKFSECPIN